MSCAPCGRTGSADAECSRAPLRGAANLAPRFLPNLPSCRRSSHVRFRMNMYKLREERDIKPATFGHMVSAMLYEKRCVRTDGCRRATARR